MGKKTEGGNYNSDRPMVRKATGKAAPPKPTPKKLITRKTKSKNTTGSGGRTNGYPNGINPNPPTPTSRKRKGPICGKPRSGNSSSGEGICCNPAGARTPHLGSGSCWLHGGNLPAEVRAGELKKANEAVVLLGLPKTVDPYQALMDELHQTAGHVEWLRVEIIQNLDDPKQLTQITDAGVEPSVWINMYQRERQHLVDVAKSCIAAGIAERQVRIQEDQGKLMAMVLMAITRDPDLNLTPAQALAAPKLTRKHLLAAPTDFETVELHPAVAEEIIEHLMWLYRLLCRAQPTARIRGASYLLQASVVGWIYTQLTIDEPPIILAISWLAIILTCVDALLTTDVRKEEDAGEEVP